MAGEPGGHTGAIDTGLPVCLCRLPRHHGTALFLPDYGKIPAQFLSSLPYPGCGIA